MTTPKPMHLEKAIGVALRNYDRGLPIVAIYKFLSDVGKHEDTAFISSRSRIELDLMDASSGGRVSFENFLRSFESET